MLTHIVVCRKDPNTFWDDLRSETQPVEVLGVSLPILEHLHLQIEMDGHAHQRGDLQSRRRPDLLQALPLSLIHI